MNFDGKQQFDKILNRVVTSEAGRPTEERKPADEISKAIQDLKEYLKQVRKIQHTAVKNMFIGETKSMSSVIFRLKGPAGKIINDSLALETCVRTEKKIALTVPVDETTVTAETAATGGQQEESPDQQIIKAIQNTKDYLKQALKLQRKAVKNMFSSETKSDSWFVFRMIGPSDKAAKDILIVETFIKTEKKCTLAEDPK